MSDRQPSFDEVLGSARHGSPWALGWLYRRFQPGLLRMLAVIAPHHAEDIAAGRVARRRGQPSPVRG